MYNIFSKFFSNYQIYQVHGGTVYVPIYKCREKDRGITYFGIASSVPDLKALILTTADFNKKEFAKKSYGHYIGRTSAVDEDTIRSCGRLSMASALEAIELHREFVAFKKSYHKVKIVKYV
jgi:hypothetical protein